MRLGWLEGARIGGVGTGGCGAPPSASSMRLGWLEGASIGGVGTGGCGAPPSASSMRLGWVEGASIGGVGTGGCGAPPSAFSMGFGWCKDCKTAEDPASAIHTNRVIQTAFRKTMVPPFYWVLLWSLSKQEQKPVGGYLNLLGIRSKIVFSVNP